jgi:signal transduction histidine kinase
VAIRRVDPWVLIRFTDNGGGIDPSVLDRIFDPFFTTKPLGKGTGLGLSICYGIIKDHNGQISVKSKKGSGTTFEVRLPMEEMEESNG